MHERIRIVGATLWFLLSAYPPGAAATSRAGNAQDMGIGFALGQPFGATAKYWLSGTKAVDVHLGYHFNSNVDLHADVLWHSFSSFAVQEGRLPFYAGLGGRTLLGNDSQLGARFPLGVAYLGSTKPMEFFAEIAPLVEVAPSFGMDIDGLVGFRFYLNYSD